MLTMDFESLLEACRSRGMLISQVMLEREMELSGKSASDIEAKMLEAWLIMQNSATQAITQPIPSMGGLIGGEAKRIAENDNRDFMALSGLQRKAVMYAMSVMEVNASMGVIVAAPTAGSSGVVPGVLLSLQEAYNISDQKMVEALFTAGAIGFLINQSATVAGAEGGCQAEVGSAAAMAAAATVQLFGGTVEQALAAASIALANLLGLVCDPVRGLVEMPCILRNAQGAMTALCAAELALSGIQSPVALDEMIKIMYRVGQSMPMELRETGLGGMASASCFGNCDGCGGCG